LEVVDLAEQIIEKHPEIELIVPHIAFDQLIGKFIKDGNWWRFICDWEYEIISRCDLFIIGHQLDPKISSGMIWEWSFAKRFNKEIIDVRNLLK